MSFWLDRWIKSPATLYIRAMSEPESSSIHNSSTWLYNRVESSSRTWSTFWFLYKLSLLPNSESVNSHSCSAFNCRKGIDMTSNSHCYSLHNGGWLDKFLKQCLSQFISYGRTRTSCYDSIFLITGKKLSGLNGWAGEYDHELTYRLWSSLGRSWVFGYCLTVLKENHARRPRQAVLKEGHARRPCFWHRLNVIWSPI
jgi:hypothetical protein